ncbi:hypothetical protein H1C71_001747 [Ictidomys tridecemlineatus]|nr:hypothetical protein H1C71_001747 [Ictidomys tridecemlineatus]
MAQPLQQEHARISQAWDTFPPLWSDNSEFPATAPPCQEPGLGSGSILCPPAKLMTMSFSASSPGCTHTRSSGDSLGHLTAQLLAKLLLTQVASSGPWGRVPALPIRGCLCACQRSSDPLTLSPPVHTTSSPSY